MAGFATPEVDNQLEPTPDDKGQFGVALEPQVVKICLYALVVGLIGGLFPALRAARLPIVEGLYPH